MDIHKATVLEGMWQNHTFPIIFTITFAIEDVKKKQKHAQAHSTLLFLVQRNEKKSKLLLSIYSVPDSRLLAFYHTSISTSIHTHTKSREIATIVLIALMLKAWGSERLNHVCRDRAGMQCRKSYDLGCGHLVVSHCLELSGANVCEVVGNTE